MNLLFLMLLCAASLILAILFVLFKAHELKLTEDRLVDYLKAKLSDWQPEESEHSLGTAHCLVMEVGEALEEESKIIQYQKMQIVFPRVREYRQMALRKTVDIPKRAIRPLLKAVK